jgi:hypothetical protein
VDEESWYLVDEPTMLLGALKERVSQPRLWLFVTSCIRLLWNQLSPSDQKNIQRLEMLASGNGELHTLNLKRSRSKRGGSVEAMARNIAIMACSIQSTLQRPNEVDLAWLLKTAMDVGRQTAIALTTLQKEFADKDSKNGSKGMDLQFDWSGKRKLIAFLIHCIFGNPFRPVTLDPRWLSSTVLDLARTIYDEKVFERMPILGDALMDAGCDCEEIIKHCQGPGPHVRGCWVVDLVLGKA